MFADIFAVEINIDTQRILSKADKKCLYCQNATNPFANSVPPHASYILQRTDGNRDRHFRYQRNSSNYSVTLDGAARLAPTSTYGYLYTCEKFCSSRN